MKVLENITIYKCDFCKKELKRKHAMATHEERCNCNPVNDRPCLNCPKMERKEIEFETNYQDYHSGESVMRKGMAFFCTAKNIFLLHPKVKYLQDGENLKWVYEKDEEVEQFDMPTQCDIFDDRIGFDIFD